MSDKETGITAQGRAWIGYVAKRRGCRVIVVNVRDPVTGYHGGGDCQWDASPRNRNPQQPTRKQMQDMADKAEIRYPTVAR